MRQLTVVDPTAGAATETAAPLAPAVEESAAGGEPVREVLHRRADGTGVRPGVDGGGQEVVRVLERYGLEPRHEDASVVLGDRPFHAPARAHADGVRHEPVPVARSPRRARGDRAGGLPGTGTGPAPRPPGARRPTRPPGGAP